MYPIATIPLIRKLNCKVDDVKQVWYADDASATGKITQVRKWWNYISSEGPKYGYYANASKTWLVTKEKFLATAITNFEGTDVRVTAEGKPYLGAAIVHPELCARQSCRMAPRAGVSVQNCNNTAPRCPCCFYTWAFQQVVLFNTNHSWNWPSAIPLGLSDKVKAYPCSYRSTAAQ